MKKILSFVFLLFISISCFSQIFGPRHCDWWPDKDFHHHWVLCNDSIPRIWKDYPEANHIFLICNAWKIETDIGYLIPRYIIWKTDSAASVSNIDACQFAYNYFVKNPKKRKYEHEQFIVLVEAVKKE